MTKSFQIARISGIDVSLHWTFILFLGWIFVSGLLNGASLAGASIGLVFVIAAFTCVLLHELGHATAASWYGIPTHGIMLMPIGGVAQLDRIPRNPWQELVIAIAGPAVNVAIAAALYSLMVISSDLSFEPLAILHGSLINRLLTVNLGLVLFNLIPAFPMDGGRILRALVASVAEYEFATWLAARCGQMIAMALAIAGLYFNPMLLLVAGFVIMAAQAELNEVRYAGRRAEPILAEIIDPLQRIGPVEHRGVSWRSGSDLLPPFPPVAFPVIHIDIVDEGSPSVFGR